MAPRVRVELRPGPLAALCCEEHGELTIGLDGPAIRTELLELGAVHAALVHGPTWGLPQKRRALPASFFVPLIDVRGQRA